MRVKAFEKMVRSKAAFWQLFSVDEMTNALVTKVEQYGGCLDVSFDGLYKTLDIVIRRLDGIEGYYDVAKNQIVLGQLEQHVLVHELMHMVQRGLAGYECCRVLDELVAEVIANKVYPKIGRFYGALIEQLVDTTSCELDMDCEQALGLLLCAGVGVKEARRQIKSLFFMRFDDVALFSRLASFVSGSLADVCGARIDARISRRRARRLQNIERAVTQIYRETGIGLFQRFGEKAVRI